MQSRGIGKYCWITSRIKRWLQLKVYQKNVRAMSFINEKDLLFRVKRWTNSQEKKNMWWIGNRLEFVYPWQEDEPPVCLQDGRWFPSDVVFCSKNADEILHQNKNIWREALVWKIEIQSCFYNAFVYDNGNFSISDDSNADMGPK